MKRSNISHKGTELAKYTKKEAWLLHPLFLSPCLCVLRERNPRKYYTFYRAVVLIFAALLLFPLRVMAQDPSVPYLLPQTIFVGDQGRLVVPLSQVFAGVEPFVLEAPAKLPEAPDLVIHRIELERRPGFSRLLIDFIPYAPGTLTFPPLEFLSSGAEPLTLNGLEAQIASILDPSHMALSQPAPPLAVPGTSLLVYGSIVFVLVILFLGIIGSLWGRRHFTDIWERLRRRHLLRVMMKLLYRLGREGDLGKKGKPDYFLSLLAAEFREFLSVFTGINCRSMTAGEFLELPLMGNRMPPDGAPSDHISPDGGSPLTPVFLCRLFRSWDTLRFSGRGVDRIDLFHALKETEAFVAALDKVEREQTFRVMEGAVK